MPEAVFTLRAQDKSQRRDPKLELERRASMKLGLLTALYADRPLEAVLDIPRTAGLDCVEIGGGNHPRTAHCDVASLPPPPAPRKASRQTFRSRGPRPS